MKKIITRLPALFLILLLPACTTTELATSVWKQNKNPSAPTQKPQGSFKVGKPYDVDGQTYTPVDDASYDETGIASWYGPGFHGKQTANGEPYDKMDLTAAHRTLPLPSLVRVTNLQNGKSLIVRVNDRGPFARGRIIDVSRRAAELLDFINDGTAKVRVQLLTKESRAIQQSAKQIPPDQAAKLFRPQVLAMNNAQPSDVTSEKLLGGRPAAENQEPITIAGVTPQTPIQAEELPPVAGRPVLTPPPAATASPAAIQNGGKKPLPHTLDEQLAIKMAGLDKELQGNYTQDGRFMPAPEVEQRKAHPEARIFVQAGAFAKQENADRLKQKFEKIAPVSITEFVKDGKTIHRVRLGPVNTIQDADALLAQVVNAGANGARVIVE